MLIFHCKSVHTPQVLWPLLKYEFVRKHLFHQIYKHKRLLLQLIYFKCFIFSKYYVANILDTSKQYLDRTTRRRALLQQDHSP